MNDMRKLMETVEDLLENPKEVYAPTSADPKQVYEWVKTGHWSRGRFEAWLMAVTEKAAREGFDDGYQEGYENGRGEMTGLLEDRKIPVASLGHIEVLSASGHDDQLVGIVYHPHSSRDYEIYGYDSIEELKSAMLAVYNKNNLGSKNIGREDL